MARKGVRGGRGSNQYRTRGVSGVPVPKSHRQPPSAEPDPDGSAWVDIWLAETTAEAFNPKSNRGVMPSVVSDVKALTDPGEIVRWAAHPNTQVKSAALANTRCPTALLDYLMNDPETPNPVRMMVVSNWACPLSTLQYAAEHYAHETVYQASQNPYTPAAALRLYVEQGALPVEKLYFHPNMEPDLLHKAAVTGNQDERFAVASNPSCPPATLAVLVTDPSARVREAVAAHPKTSVKHLKVLAGNTESAPRIAVAGRDDIPYEVVERLADDPDTKVRVALAGNVAVPEVVLRRLVNDDYESVGQAARKTRATLRETGAG